MASGSTSSVVTNDDLDCVTPIPSGRRRPEAFKTTLAEVAFVFSVVLSLMLSEYFIAGFNVIIRPVSDSLSIPTSQRSWPTVAITTTTASLLLPFARLCDIYGCRSVFLVGQAWMVLWSVIAGFSDSGISLIVCRAMQGVGPAAFMPAAIGLLGGMYRPGPRKNLVFGVYSIFASVGFFSGIVIGALATKYLDWCWYFWIGAIIGGTGCVAGWFSIPSPDPNSQTGQRMDWLGTFTLVPALVLVVFAITASGSAPHGWQTPYIYCTFAAGFTFLLAAIYTQGWVSTEPLLPAEIFTTRYIKRLIVALFSAFGAFGLYLYYTTSFIEVSMHIDPLHTAAWFTPLVAGGICLAIGGGWAMHIISCRALMIISAAGFLLSMVLFVAIPPHLHAGMPISQLYWAFIFPAMLSCSVGVDIAFIVMNVFITTSVKGHLQATAGALTSSVFSLSLAFWLGLSELITTSQIKVEGHDSAYERTYQIGFWMGAGLSILYLLLTLSIKIEPAAASLTADEKSAVGAETPDIRSP